MNRIKTYKVAWYNGYYLTYTFIDAVSEVQAIEKAKKLFGRGRSFSFGENPASNCGIYGEPVAILDETTPRKEIVETMLKDRVEMNLRSY